MQALLDLPSPSSTLKSPRSFADNIENHIHGLEALGKSVETFGDLLTPVLLNKLPPDTLRNITRDKGNDNWSLVLLRKAMSKEAEVLEAGVEMSDTTTYEPTAAFYSTLRSSQTHQPSATRDTYLPHHNQHVYSFLSSNIGQEPHQSYGARTHQTQQAQSKQCIFCEQLHSPTDCIKVTINHQTRMKIFYRKMCLNCLGPHKASRCRSAYRCRTCGSKHHTALHDHRSQSFRLSGDQTRPYSKPQPYPS